MDFASRVESLKKRLHTLGRMKITGDMHVFIGMLVQQYCVPLRLATSFWRRMIAPSGESIGNSGKVRTATHAAAVFGLLLDNSESENDPLRPNRNDLLYVLIGKMCPEIMTVSIDDDVVRVTARPLDIHGHPMPLCDVLRGSEPHSVGTGPVGKKPKPKHKHLRQKRGLIPAGAWIDHD